MSEPPDDAPAVQRLSRRERALQLARQVWPEPEPEPALETQQEPELDPTLRMQPHEKALYRARTSAPRSPVAVAKLPSRAHEFASAETARLATAAQAALDTGDIPRVDIVLEEIDKARRVVAFCADYMAASCEMVSAERQLRKYRDEVLSATAAAAALRRTGRGAQAEYVQLTALSARTPLLAALLCKRERQTQHDGSLDEQEPACTREEQEWSLVPSLPLRAPDEIVAALSLNLKALPQTTIDVRLSPAADSSDDARIREFGFSPDGWRPGRTGLRAGRCAADDAGGSGSNEHRHVKLSRLRAPSGGGAPLLSTFLASAHCNSDGEGEERLLTLGEALQAGCDHIGQIQPQTPQLVAAALADVIEAKATCPGKKRTREAAIAVEEEKDAVAAAAAAVMRENSRWESQLESLEASVEAARRRSLTGAGASGASEKVEAVRLAEVALRQAHRAHSAQLRQLEATLADAKRRRAVRLRAMAGEKEAVRATWRRELEQALSAKRDAAEQRQSEGVGMRRMSYWEYMDRMVLPMLLPLLQDLCNDAGSSTSASDIGRQQDAIGGVAETCSIYPRAASTPQSRACKDEQDQLQSNREFQECSQGHQLMIEMVLLRLRAVASDECATGGVNLNAAVDSVRRDVTGSGSVDSTDAQLAVLDTLHVNEADVDPALAALADLEINGAGSSITTSMPKSAAADGTDVQLASLRRLNLATIRSADHDGHNGDDSDVDDDEMLMVLRGLGLEIIDVGGARDDEWDELEHKEDAQLAVLQAIRLDEKAEQHVRGDEQLAKLRRVSVNG